MSVSRRSFLENGASAALLSAFGWTGCVSSPARGETLPPWRPGNFDLHFIYTGCGENLFYRLPDGTSVLNDVGEFYRPHSLVDVPLLPSAERLGGDWVARYLRRVYDERTIDYAVFTHWHSDHIGHYSEESESAEAAFRWRVTFGGRKVNGFLCVAEEYDVRTCFDHQFPARNVYGSGDSSVLLLDAWARTRRGAVREPFRVGACDQIRLVRDPASYRGAFSVRNVTANAVAWDGANGAVDFGAEHVAVTGTGSLPQNVLSATMLFRYGKFSYFASGDLQTQVFRRKDGTSVDFETYVADRIGPVTLCKMGHHGCSNAMNAAFVRSVRADAYVACMWCPTQAYPDVLSRINAVPSAASGRRPLILPQLTCRLQRDWFAANRPDEVPPSGVHVVVRVAPGGGSYRVYLLDARDEEMRIVAMFDRDC